MSGSHHEYIGNCERCGSHRGLGTGMFVDEVGYEILCRRCAMKIIPDCWEVKTRV